MSRYEFRGDDPMKQRHLMRRLLGLAAAVYAANFAYLVYVTGRCPECHDEPETTGFDVEESVVKMRTHDINDPVLCSYSVYRVKQDGPIPRLCWVCDEPMLGGDRVVSQWREGFEGHVLWWSHERCHVPVASRR